MDLWEAFLWPQSFTQPTFSTEFLLEFYSQEQKSTQNQNLCQEVWNGKSKVPMNREEEDC